MKAIFVAPFFYSAILLESVGLKASMLDGKRMINHELGRHNWINERGVTTLRRNGIAKASKIHQCGLSKNVVTNHPGGKPGKVRIASSLNKLQ
jgi:hypothetical protein